MEIFTSIPLSSILILSGGLLVVAFVLWAIVRARKSTPQHFDRVLADATKLAGSGRPERALDLLSSETKRLAGKERRSQSLDVRLARLRLACGRLLEEIGRRADAIQQLRDAAGTPSAEQGVVDQATILLLRARSPAQQDVKLFLDYLSRAPLSIAKDDPFVLALDEDHYRRLFQDSAIRSDAVALAERLRSRGMSPVWMLRVQGQEWARSGEPERAIVALEELITNGQQTTQDDRRMLAQLLCEQGRVQAGFALYHALAEEHDATAADLRTAGRLALQQCESAKDKSAADLTAAARWLIRATNADQNDAPTWALLGRVRALQLRIDEARAAYERALACGTDDVQVRLALADILIAQNVPASALTHLRRAAELAATSSTLWVRCGNLALELGDEDAALRDFERAVACPQVDAATTLRLAEIRHRRGDHARVVALLDERNDLPDSALPILGRSLAHIGKTRQAVERLRTYAKSQGADSRVRFELGMLHGRLGEWKKAAVQFAKVADASLRSTALPYFAYVCLRSGDAAKAAQLAAEAAATGEKSALLHHVAGALAAAKGKRESAHTEWRSALELNPKFAPALYGYARFCEAERDYVTAAQLYSRLLDAEPSRRELSIRIGICHARAARYTEALAAFAAAGSDTETSTEALECLAYCHAKLQQWEEAAAALGKLPQTARTLAAVQRNEFAIRYEFTRRLYRQAKMQEARRQLEQLPAHQLGTPLVTRALYAVQVGTIAALLPPKSSDAEQSLRNELVQLQRIAPASFAARTIPALIALRTTGKAQAWNRLADVKPANYAQRIALAILAAAAGETGAASTLLTESVGAARDFLTGVLAARTKQWSIAFDALRTACGAAALEDDAMGSLLRLTAACGVAADKSAEVSRLLDAHRRHPEAARILGVLAAAEGRTDEASRLLAMPDIAGAGVVGARQLLVWQQVVAAMQSGDPAAAAVALDHAPHEIRSHPSLKRVQLDIRLRSVEASAGDAARHAKARQSLRIIAPELLLPPHHLRRAAIAATEIAVQNVGVRAHVVADHRLAAAFWATALEGTYVWDVLDRERTRQKRSPLSMETREQLKTTARERLLASMRSNAGRGWTKDEVDLGCAWIEYEFTCAMLFEKSGIGYGLSTWPKGLTAAQMLLMEDTLEADELESRSELRTARAAILAVLKEHKRERRSVDGQEDAVKIAVYILPKLGFAEFLLDTDRPHLALDHLKTSVQSDATVQKLRGRALADQASKLSKTPTDAQNALKMFEQAAALQTNLTSHRNAIIDAAVAASRSVLNAHMDNPAAALTPLDVATRLTGKATPLDQSRAAVFVQQALKLKESGDADGAIRRLREALALHGDEPTRKLQAGFLREKSISQLVKRKQQEALDTMRECIRLEQGGTESDVDYQARCDLQIEMINLGHSIATKSNVSIRDLRTAVKAGEDAMWFLKDSDSDRYLGTVLSELGRRLAMDESWNEAISSFEASLRYRDHDDTKKMLGIALYVRGAKAYDSGNRSSGSVDLKRAYQLNPGDDDIRRAYFLVRSHGW